MANCSHVLLFRLAAVRSAYGDPFQTSSTGRRRRPQYPRNRCDVADLRGYDVVAAEDGFQALVQIRNTSPDVILSDLNMPRMSGFELLSVVRRRFPHILTIAMSGAYRDDELPPGVVADGFYSKGKHPETLFRSLKHLLSEAALRSSRHHRELSPAWIPR